MKKYPDLLLIRYEALPQSPMLANPSLQLLYYETSIKEDGDDMAIIEEGLFEMSEGSEEAELPLKKNKVELLQDQVIDLDELRSKYISESQYLKDKVAMLGKVAELIKITTFPFCRSHGPVGEGDEELHLLRLRNCVERAGAASQMIFDMTRLMARDSAQK